MTLHVNGPSTSDKWLRQQWGTPAYLFHQLHREFRFTVDGAARWVNAKLSRFWSEEHNSLSFPWTGERVWVNPPFADPAAWLRKAWAEVWSGRCPLVTLLLPAALDVDWFELAALGRVEPFRGRVQFEEPPEITEHRRQEAIRTGKKKQTGGAGGGVMLIVYEPETITDRITEPVPLHFRDSKTGLYLPRRFVV